MAAGAGGPWRLRDDREVRALLWMMLGCFSWGALSRWGLIPALVREYGAEAKGPAGTVCAGVGFCGMAVWLLWLLRRSARPPGTKRWLYALWVGVVLMDLWLIVIGVRRLLEARSTRDAPPGAPEAGDAWVIS